MGSGRQGKTTLEEGTLAESEVVAVGIGYRADCCNIWPVGGEKMEGVCVSQEPQVRAGWGFDRVCAAVYVNMLFWTTTKCFANPMTSSFSTDYNIQTGSHFRTGQCVGLLGQRDSTCVAQHRPKRPWIRSSQRCIEIRQSSPPNTRLPKSHGLYDVNDPPAPLSVHHP